MKSEADIETVRSKRVARGRAAVPAGNTPQPEMPDAPAYILERTP